EAASHPLLLILVPRLFARRPPSSTLFPYTTLFRSGPGRARVCRRARWWSCCGTAVAGGRRWRSGGPRPAPAAGGRAPRSCAAGRSEEHTSELQSRENLVCRLLLEKKKNRARRARRE